MRIDERSRLVLVGGRRPVAGLLHVHCDVGGLHEVAHQCVTPDQIPIAQVGQGTVVVQSGRDLEKVISRLKRIAGHQIGSRNELLGHQGVRISGEDLTNTAPAPSCVQVKAQSQDVLCVERFD